MKVTKITEWANDYSNESHWINCTLYYVGDIDTYRVMLTYRGIDQNICNLTGESGNGSLADVYYGNDRMNVVTRLFVNASILNNPKSDAFMYHCIPFMEITRPVSLNAIIKSTFRTATYAGKFINIDVPDYVQQLCAELRIQRNAKFYI